MRFALTAVIALCLPLPGGAEVKDRAGWFRNAQWGVFMHYLAESADLPVGEWNRRVDGFNVEGLANQLQAAGARYFFITLGQNSGHYLSPNRTYDEFVGIEPSKCSKRDLVADLHRALAPRRIKLLVYLPAGAPDQDRAAMEKLEWKRGPFRNAAFQRKWEKVIEEWSVRWGDKVAGWWFDGCYWPNAMYRSPEPPNYASFAAAARKGNSDAIVAFNRGVVSPIHSETDQEDYTAGEIDDPTTVAFGDFWRDGAQPHMLSYLGKQWSAGPPRFSPEQAAAITAKLVSEGGVVTWDTPHEPDGLIPAEFLSRLRAIGIALAGRRGCRR